MDAKAPKKSTIRVCGTRKTRIGLDPVSRDKKSNEKSGTTDANCAAIGDQSAGDAKMTTKAGHWRALDKNSIGSVPLFISPSFEMMKRMNELLPITDFEDSAQNSFSILRSEATLRHMGPVYLVHLNNDSGDIVTSSSYSVQMWDMTSKSVKSLHYRCGDGVISKSFWNPLKVQSGLAVLHHTDNTVKFMLKGKIISWDAKSDGTFVRETDPPSGTFLGQSPNGTFVLTSSGMWSAQTRQYVAPAIRDESGITHVAISLNGRRVAIGTKTGNIVVWEYDAVNKQWINKLTIKTRCGVICMSPDGTLLASGSNDLKMWKLHRNPADCSLHACELGPTHTPMMLNGVSILRFSPDGKRLVCGGKSGDIQVWNSSDVRLEYKLAGHTAFILSLAFSQNGELLVSGSSDWTARTWRLPALPKDPEHAPEFLRCNCFLRYSGMNIRTGPSTSHEIKGLLRQDEVIRVLEKKGNWVRHARGWSGWKCGKTNEVQLVQTWSRSAHWVPVFIQISIHGNINDTKGVYVESDEKDIFGNQMVVYAGPHTSFGKIGTLKDQSTNLVLEQLHPIELPIDSSDARHVKLGIMPTDKAIDRRGMWIRVSEGWIYRNIEHYRRTYNLRGFAPHTSIVEYKNFIFEFRSDVSADVADIDEQYASDMMHLQHLL